MSGLGQNIHLLHCASAVRAAGGSGADWGAMMRLQWYWCQSVAVQPRTVKAIKSGCTELRHSKRRETPQAAEKRLERKEKTIENLLNVLITNVDCGLHSQE